MTAGQVALIVDVKLQSLELPLSWQVGPLPLSGATQGQALIADQATRSSYFARGAARALYGDRTATSRWHRTGNFAESIAGLDITAIEIASAVLTEVGASIPAEVVLHLGARGTSPAIDIDALHRLVRTRPGREELAEILSRLAPIERSSGGLNRIFSICFSEHDEAGSKPERILQNATLTSANTRPPGRQELDQVRSDTTCPTQDWAYLVRRDGVAFEVAAGSEFSDALAFYALTIYLDLFLLGRFQTRFLSSLDDQLSDIAWDSLDANAVQALVHDISLFRACYAPHTVSDSATARDLFSAYMAEHDVSRAADSLFARATDLSSSVALRAAIQGERAAHRTNAALGVIAVLGLPLGITLTIWEAVSGGVLELCIAIVAALGASALLLFLVPGLRYLVGRPRGIQGSPT